MLSLFPKTLKGPQDRFFMRHITLVLKDYIKVAAITFLYRLPGAFSLIPQ